MTGAALSDWLAEGTARLLAAGVPGAARDARLLLADLVGVAPGHLLLADVTPAPGQRAAFEARIAARAGGKPVSKIIGRRAFWNTEFTVTEDVLDPRPETETLIAAALARPFSRLLDLGTGSGCIAITLCQERPGATALATDMSEAALGVARGNVAAAGLAGRVTLQQSDWFGTVTGQFDLIVSNPPYIAADEMAALMPEVRDHDPAMALTDGADGLSAYRAIAAGAARHLLPGGALIVEIGPTQGAAVAAMLAAAGLADIAVLPDIDGRDRVVKGILPGK